MRTIRFFSSDKPALRVMLLLFLVFTGTGIFAQQDGLQQTTLYRGEVLNDMSGDPIASAQLSVSGTNISTITNSSGEFSLKIPSDLRNSKVTISALGYNSSTLPLESFKRDENTIVRLQEAAEELGEVSLYYTKDARSLVQNMLNKRGENYFTEETEMTAFYRETIKKRRRNVSLSEAVVKIHKQPYDSGKKDDVALYKARKSSDYKRLDTIALKLRGGPFNALYVDVMKYPEFLFQQDALDIYKFSFDKPTMLNKRYIYVVNFNQRQKDMPWYHGQLFIDAESLTLVKAKYSLNVDNRSAAARMFVMKKPAGARVYPVEVGYQIDYRKSDGKWYYGYGQAQLEFVVNWKHKLFNSHYTLDSEMAVTDWEKYTKRKSGEKPDYIKPSVVMSDDVSGFADVEFWGETNIIEPDKPIQNAIRKIQRQLERKNN
ncbi:MAG: carboxypeptidase-like regulatory domain-containing protein [Salegentibacter sp.]